MKYHFIKYKSYTAFDFMQEESFISDVRKGGFQVNSFWIELIGVFPHLQREMDTAQSYMLLIQDQPGYFGEQHKVANWSKIRQVMDTGKESNVFDLKRYLRWISVAASVILLVLVSIELYQLGPKSLTTGYGKQQEWILPDESVVRLNSNSKLHYIRDWKSSKPREVWLDGEGMFDVKHTALANRINQNDYFIVHVSDLKLTVLGTKFNVRDRRDRIEVSLFEGSLEVADGNGALVVLKPGEQYVYNIRSKVGEHIVGFDEVPIQSWTKQELNVEHFSLEDVIEVLEDNFGYQVDVKDSALLQQRLTGVIPMTSAADIVFVIRHTFDLHVRVRDNVIHIEKK